MRRESSPSSVLDARIPLKVELPDLTVDFALSWFLFVGGLLEKACSPFLVGVWQTLRSVDSHPTEHDPIRLLVTDLLSTTCLSHGGILCQLGFVAIRAGVRAGNAEP